MYDIIYPKKGQLTLLCNGSILANSKKKSYLINRMLVNQDECISAGIAQENTYQIVDMFQNNRILETHFFKEGESGNGKKRKPQGKNINFVAVDPIRPIFSVCYAIADVEGSIITDMDLLGELYDFRYRNPIGCEITNKTLAYLATYVPRSKEEIIDCFGFGEKKYEKCGKMFLKFIKEYLERRE